MRRALLLSIPVLAVLIPFIASPARAEVGWVAGADFRVGGASFSLGFHGPAVSHYGRYQPAYYYRVGTPLSYPGVRCTSACYLRDGYHHHHPSCPVVAGYFGRYDFHPTRIWASIGVPHAYYGHRPPAYGYRPPPRPYYRYDPRFEVRRYDDHRGHGRHGRGHGRGHHKHGPGCGHH
jgi:hypothetical protein